MYLAPVDLAPHRAPALATYLTPYRATVLRPRPTTRNTLLLEALNWLAGGVAFAALVWLTIALLTLTG